MSSLRLLCLAPLAACAASTNDVTIALAPDVVSSIDAKLAVHAIVFADREPQPGKSVDLAVDYTDRNGNPHAITVAGGKTDKTGALDAEVDGLMWDGYGTVTATVTNTMISDVASFAVLDRTPPKATIEPPANNQVRVNSQITIQVHVTDEIGVSQVWFETDRNGGGFGNGGARSSVVASGATDTMVGFDFQVSDTATIGSTITMYALAEDLSGNQAAAQPITVTVAP